VVGVEDASGFISVVGNRMGDAINNEYRRSLAVDNLAKDQLAEVLVDLKQRINGDFYIISQDDQKIILGNRRCPFGDKVKGKRSLCMMTSNVFGKIAAENLGHARVDLEKTIADHAPECRIVIYFNASTDHTVKGREYYQELS
jgi:predicted ArsR family transcriptional regulator